LTLKKKPLYKIRNNELLGRYEMRLVLTPVYIVSLCLSLVNGADLSEEQALSSENEVAVSSSELEVFSIETEEDDMGMGERTDSVSFYAQSRLDPNAVERKNGALDLFRRLEEQMRVKSIRSGAFKGEGAFSAQYVGGVIPKERTQTSLLREAKQNNLTAVVLEIDKVVLAIPRLSKPGVSNDSSVGEAPLPKPTYMKRTESVGVFDTLDPK
jgi:hypothetical protein